MDEPTHRVLYKFPEPATSILKGPVYRSVPGKFRQQRGMSTLTYAVKHQGQIIIEELQFIETVAYSYYSLFAIPPTAVPAYAKVIDIADSSLLQEIKSRIESRPSGKSTSDLRHLAILFDDGPYYDFIRRDFAHVRKNEQGAEIAE